MSEDFADDGGVNGFGAACITTQVQLEKFIQSLQILTFDVLSQTHFYKDFTTVTNGARAEGILVGFLIERHLQDSPIDLQFIQDSLLRIQRSQGIIGKDGSTVRNLRTFFARTSENINQAFDIALNDKPLPPIQRPDGPVQRV